MSAGAITDTDRGYKVLLARLAKEQQGRVVDVGVMGSEAGDAKLTRVNKKGDIAVTDDTVAGIATIHEFGLGVPERSFIRAYVDEHQPQIEAMLRKAAEDVVTGKVQSFDVALGRIGLKIRDEIKERIRSGIEPGLAEATKDRKGSSTPLIDTGQLISSITWELRRISGGG